MHDPYLSNTYGKKVSRFIIFESSYYTLAGFLSTIFFVGDDKQL